MGAEASDWLFIAVVFDYAKSGEGWWDDGE